MSLPLLRSMSREKASTDTKEEALLTSKATWFSLMSLRKGSKVVSNSTAKKEVELGEAHGEGREVGGGGDAEGEAFVEGAGGRGDDGEGEARGEGSSVIGLGVKKMDGVDKEGFADGEGGAGGLVGGESDDFVREEGVTVEGEVVGGEERECNY
ncbi:hypothetical protein DEO72_LG10g2 [Vigna unguiculata]|uniref:Uncharacterized protein n=1 Tax=Vigna unguiculata TaxID=3917 RepID=A0A4D6N9D9_VIGUN|nr:hypothetical protein DEO72_LG10g2 [Vigna unguiculata]